jgi:CHAT domain-containing protein
MIELLLSEGRVEEAFSYAERARARVLLSVVQGGRASVTKSMSPKEVADERDLVDRIADLNRSITALKQNTGTDPGRVAELEKELKAARADHENFRLRLYSAHPELMVQRGEMKAVTLAETRQLLPDSGSAIAEFVVSEKKAFVFVFTLDRAQKATIKPIILNIDGKTLADKIEAYRSSVAAGDLGFQQKGAELYDLLIKPVEPQLRGIRDLAIVPDGPLWGMPFQALNDRTGKYLVERMAISYAPSVTVLAAMRKKGSAADTAGRRELIAFGNPIPGRETSERVQKVFMGEKLEPLPEAERLVNELRRMYGPAKSEVYTGLGASEEVAKSQMPKFKIIQFATHGILDDANPLYSHLVLSQSSGDQNEDGLLEAWEMKDLDLGADMVILSACDTARGRFSSGEGVIGMTWAMFIAGASATVASQWSVESSSTTELMLEFHRQLLARLRTSKAEALRQAELKVMRMPRYRHPSYWAGFVVVGNGN